MKRRPRRNLFAAATAATAALFACGAAAQTPCKTEALGTATIVAVRDARTIATSDGREIRLAGIEVPPQDSAAGKASAAAITALAGGTLRLGKLGTDSDRYGRLVAFAYPDGAQLSLQQALLEQGQARVSARIGDKACTAALLTSERNARTARRGLWADPNFAPLQAEHLDRLQAERGHFALIEGKVLSVRESGATIYVNFGRRWTRDFTVIILKRQQRIFAAAGGEPKQLEGRRIRVRGWIEQRGGPIVMAEAPEQIEFVE